MPTTLTRFRALPVYGLALLLIGVPGLSAKEAGKPEKPAPAVSKRNHTADDSGLLCLLILCREAGVKATLPELRRLSRAKHSRPTLADLERGAKAKGLNVAVTRVDATSLARQQGSGIAWTGRVAYIAFGPAGGNQAWLEDPVAKTRRKVTYAEIVGRAQGLVLLRLKGRLERLD